MSTPHLFRAPDADGSDYVWKSGSDPDRPIPVIGLCAVVAHSHDEQAALDFWTVVCEAIPEVTS